ncbi:metallophosphoesterase family protein [Macrococcoides caseolyticum]|uniref:metallophosphoesterase family protein n=1 Tax=Macrococcoides caseolyticum TaxID=69966 RepID=UPI001F417E82|nr:metallophosphoesterase family protein [Macrococcus caseolyticus]MCE4957415.1 serine/threonine protein phosphatase [Macrococcus caseolyticus]
MHYFIVGDIHGCYNTLKKLLKHWNPKAEQLIFVGDYINKGKHSKEVVQLIRKLQTDYPNTICIKGNHEYQMAQYIFSNTPKHHMKENYKYTITHYDLKHKYISDAKWMQRLPLFYENNVLYVSHAGVNFLGFRKFHEDSMWSVLRFRGKLKKMKKLQVIGHTPTEIGKPIYLKQEHVLNIDAGAGNYDALAAVVINKNGKLVQTYIEKVLKSDCI